MTVPAKPVAWRSAALTSLALLLLAVSLLALCAPGALADSGASASASPAAHEPTVNMTWLIIGLGIPSLALVIFYFIRRGGRRSDTE